MEKGYMILPRNYFDSEAWKQKRVYSDAEAWLDIVRSARYDKDSCTAVINEKSVTWSRGEWPVSLRFLADRWQWSIRRVRSYLIKLCDHQLIAIRNSQVMNIIQVNDYNLYCGTANGTGNDTANGTANGTVARASEGTVRRHDKTLTVTDIQSWKPSLSAQQNECNRQANGTVNGTANETVNDTANDTKKNKDFNISINNFNHAHEDEKNIHNEIQKMMANEAWKEAICMRHHISSEQLAQHLELFAADCICCGRQSHLNMMDALSHFHHWLRIQLQQQNASSNNNTKSYNNANTSSRRNSKDYIREAQQWAIHQSEKLIQQAALRHNGIQDNLPV